MGIYLQAGAEHPHCFGAAADSPLYNVSDEASHLAKIVLWLHGGLGVLLWPLSFTLPQALKAAGILPLS